MHRMHNHPQSKDGAQTSGITIHWAGRYDVLTRLFGMGVNGANSRMVIELAKVRAGDRVLDVGCGTGNLTLTAKSYAGPAGAVQGIDAAREMIGVARQKAKRAAIEAAFEVGLIESLPYPEDSFDVVVSRLVVHHLPLELKQLGFAEIQRVLKPGGLFLAADFTPPTSPILSHIMTALVGPTMMQSSMQGLPELLAVAGFVETASGPTRSAFLAFVSGRKPAATVVE